MPAKTSSPSSQAPSPRAAMACRVRAKRTRPARLHASIALNLEDRGGRALRCSPMRYRPLATLITATAAVLLLTATARADFQTLYDDYRADGGIDGCAYSSSYLSAGLSEIPADVREYDPGFSEAINTALEQVAAGCGTAPPAAATRNEATAADGSPGPVAPR